MLHTTVYGYLLLCDGIGYAGEACVLSRTFGASRR